MMTPALLKSMEFAYLESELKYMDMASSSSPHDLDCINSIDDLPAIIEKQIAEINFNSQHFERLNDSENQQLLDILKQEKIWVESGCKVYDFTDHQFDLGEYELCMDKNIFTNVTFAYMIKIDASFYFVSCGSGTDEVYVTCLNNEESLTADSGPIKVTEGEDKATALALLIAYKADGLKYTEKCASIVNMALSC